MVGPYRSYTRVPVWHLRRRLESRTGDSGASNFTINIVAIVVDDDGNLCGLVVGDA